MKNTTQVADMIRMGQLDERLLDIYVDKDSLIYQRQRYLDAISQFESNFSVKDISIYSAPGRSEIGGNHTDHQRGEVLVAAVNLDAIAIVQPTKEEVVEVLSNGFEKVTVSLADLEKKEEEEGTTKALIKGVLKALQVRGYHLGGFLAYITSDVLIGAGLSSSAAFEVLIGTIVSGLYNHMEISPVEIAIMGQYAENVYFGKPCGLMDQMASSVGNLVHIDFEKENEPVIDKVECDFETFGYSLCITDTKSSHADCTPEYAQVPKEMKQVAAVFGKEVLRQVTMEELLSKMEEVRTAAGDRGALRAIHFLTENERVKKETQALNTGDFKSFLQNVKASGDSSFKYLQNVYMNKDVTHQNVSLALALSEVVLGDCGTCRVHGGGFAGTIQAFVKNEAVNKYQKAMNNHFGEGACSVLKIRKYGGIQVL